MSHLVEILLPLADNEGRPQGADLFAAVRAELTGRFGGLTAFTRAPAVGLWAQGGETARDDVVVLEVMSETLDRPWWSTYRASLESRFRQEVVLIRASRVERL